MRCVCYAAETKNTLRFIHLFIHYHKCIITITKRQFLLNKKSLCLSSEATFSWIKDRKLTDLPRGVKTQQGKQQRQPILEDLIFLMLSAVGLNTSSTPLSALYLSRLR